MKESKWGCEKNESNFFGASPYNPDPNPLKILRYGLGLKIAPLIGGLNFIGLNKELMGLGLEPN